MEIGDAPTGQTRVEEQPMQALEVAPSHPEGSPWPVLRGPGSLSWRLGRMRAAAVRLSWTLHFDPPEPESPPVATPLDPLPTHTDPPAPGLFRTRQRSAPA
jgi:hypothetical protein